MAYHFVKLLSWLVRILPRDAREAMGDLLGAVAWPFVPARRRDTAVANAMASLGLDRSAALAVVRRSAVRFGRMFMEVLCLPGLTGDNIGRFVTLRGRENLEAAFAHGRGIILVTAHSGNWELMGPALALYGFPIVGVVQKQTNAAMDRVINEFRRASGMHVTYKSGVREMVSLLGQGKGIGLIMDQDAKEQGIFTEFFGRVASAPQGPAVLARLKDVPLVPLFITANADGTHTLVIHPALWVEKTADREADYLAITKRLNAILEDHIRAHPHEWFWLHNRWKTRPPEGYGRP